jgi:integrase
MEPLGQDPLVKMVLLSSLQRDLAKPTRKKEPITLDVLQQVVDSVGQTPTLSEIRLLTIMLLAFAAFLRFDEIAKLRCCDVQFHDAHMSIRIIASKTDQYREGNEVVVSRARSKLCPVSMVERYFSMAQIETNSSECLFRAIVHTKNGEKLRNSGSLSYTRVRELLLAKLQVLGYDSSMFGVHSLRAGGATRAANNGVPDRMFKRHGRWKSESAKDGYVKDALDARLAVTKKLEL